eukprot:5643127-Prymnesium_polylepis.1
MPGAVAQMIVVSRVSARGRVGGMGRVVAGGTTAVMLIVVHARRTVHRTYTCSPTEPPTSFR